MTYQLNKNKSLARHGLSKGRTFKLSKGTDFGKSSAVKQKGTHTHSRPSSIMLPPLNFSIVSNGSQLKISGNARMTEI